MTLDPAVDSAWAARVAEVGVTLKRFDEVDGDRDYFSLQHAILAAARDELLSDEDLYPLLVRFWTGSWPPCDWPPDAPAAVRRCAAILAARRRCGYDRGFGCPTDEAIQAARDVLIAELALTPAKLLAVLADHWPRLHERQMPDDGGSSLLNFAEDVLLTPLVGACLLHWMAADQLDVATPRVPEAPAKPDAWTVWSGADLHDRCEDLVAAELVRLGDGRASALADDSDADELLGVLRAARLSEHEDIALIAASVARTSGWPGDATIITSLAEDAIRLALSRPPPNDDDEHKWVDALQCDVMPARETIVGWLSDVSVGTYEDGAGLAATGAHMLERVADWVTWYVSHQAYLIARASLGE